MTSTTDALGNSTSYTYRKDGLLTEIKDASGAATLYEYDSKGLVSKETDALGAVTTYEYDSENRPVKVVTPDGTVTEYIYNTDGSITRVTATKVNGEAEELCYLYNFDGSLNTSVSSTDILEYTYNNRGSVASVTKNNNHQVKLSYDGNGNITRLEELTKGVTESVTNYAYDNRGYLTKVNNAEGLLASYTSRADGLLEQVTDGAGNVTKYQYDQKKHVTGVTITAADGSVLYSEKNTYDKNGSLLTQNISGTGYEAESLTYTYDALDRLLSETNKGVTTTYTYDSMGNRLTKTIGDVTTLYTYDLCNKLLSETTGEEENVYSYDALGNLVTKTNSTGVTNYVYDALNQLTKVTNPDGTWQSNAYDASGIRSMLTENGVTTEFMTFNGLVLSGYNKNSERTEHYYYGNSLIAAEYAQNAETALYYYLTNSHGDVIGLTDTYGTLTEKYRYDTFGTLTSIQSMNENGVLAEAQTALSKFLYAGEQYDTVTGFYYLRARQYDTALGRFTQEDAYLGDGRNLYVYVRNNPLKYVDPSGHCGKGLGVDLWDRMNAPYIEMSETALELYDPVLEAQRKAAEKEKAAKGKAWLEALITAFSCPDSYSGYYAQQWGKYIAPTVKSDPAGSAYAFKEGLLDAIIPFRSSNDYYYDDLYLTGQLFGMIFTGGVSEYLSGLSAVKNISMINMSPAYAFAGGDSWSSAVEITADGALLLEGLGFGYFGYSVGTTVSNANSAYKGSQSYLSNQQANQIKNEILEGNDVHFNSKEEALEFIKKKFPEFAEEVAGNRSSEGWHFDSHPINGSIDDIEHINIYSKKEGFRVHITWGK